MAYGRTHAYENFGKDLADDKVGNLLFLHGEETYLVAWAVETLVHHYVNDATKALDLVRLDPDSFDMDRMVEACETLPMMSPRKVVILERFSLLWKPGRSEALRSEEAQKRFTEYLDRVPEQTILVVAAPEAEDYRTRRYGNRLSKGLVKAGREYDFDLLEGEPLLGFIKKRLVAAKKTASRETLEMLVAESGYSNREIDYDLFHLDNDLKKIIALTDGEEITPREVALGVSDNLEHNAFLFLDNISSGRKGEAFAQVNQLLRSGNNEFQLLARIIGQMELMLMVRELQDNGASMPQITKILGVKEYPVKKAMKFSRNYDLGRLQAMLKSAFAVEKNIKEGLFPGELALEMFIARL